MLSPLRRRGFCHSLLPCCAPHLPQTPLAQGVRLSWYAGFWRGAHDLSPLPRITHQTITGSPSSLCPIAPLCLLFQTPDLLLALSGSFWADPCPRVTRCAPGTTPSQECFRAPPPASKVALGYRRVGPMDPVHKNLATARQDSLPGGS